MAPGHHHRSSPPQLGGLGETNNNTGMDHTNFTNISNTTMYSNNNMPLGPPPSYTPGSKLRREQMTPMSRHLGASMIMGNNQSIKEDMLANLNDVGPDLDIDVDSEMLVGAVTRLGGIQFFDRGKGGPGGGRSNNSEYGGKI